MNLDAVVDLDAPIDLDGQTSAGFDATIPFDSPLYAFNGVLVTEPSTPVVVAGGRLPFPLTLVPPKKKKKKKPKITVPDLPPLAPEPVAAFTDDEFLLLA